MGTVLIIIGILTIIGFFGMSVSSVLQQNIQYLTLIAGAIFLCGGCICKKLEKIENRIMDFYYLEKEKPENDKNEEVDK